MNSLTELLYPLLRGMVVNPDKLKITENASGRFHVIAIAPAASDYRILCGTGGRTIRALQALTSLLGDATGKPAKLELRENFDYQKAPNQPFAPDPKFDHEACIATIKRFVAVIFDRPIHCVFESADDGLRALIDIDLDNEKEVSTVFALAEAFYPYGYRRGCLVKIKALKTWLAKNQPNEK